MEEHITTMAGAVRGTYMKVESLLEVIRDLRINEQQRDTFYQVKTQK